MKFEELLDKELGHEVLKKYTNRSDKYASFRLQKKIIKIFLRLLKEDLLNHGFFFFPKKQLSLQIASVNRRKTQIFRYSTGNTDAIGFIRTSHRFFKKMKLVKPYFLLRADVYKEANKKHEHNQYFRKV